MEMRSPARQVEGLAIVWDLLPQETEAKLIVDDAVVDVPVLHVGSRDLTFVSDGFELWTAGPGRLLEQDLDVKQAVDRLVAS